MRSHASSRYSRAPEVLGLPPSARIYFATGLVDMRNGIDGLHTIVEQVLERNPNEGHLFVFVGKRRDQGRTFTAAPGSAR